LAGAQRQRTPDGISSPAKKSQAAKSATSQMATTHQTNPDSGKNRTSMTDYQNLRGHSSVMSAGGNSGISKAGQHEWRTAASALQHDASAKVVQGTSQQNALERSFTPKT